MRRNNGLRLAAYTLGAAGLILAVGCGKKKNDDGDEATTTTVQGAGGGSSGGGSTVASVDGATVAAATSALQLGSSITIIPAKEGGAALALQGSDLDAAIANVHYRVDERSLDQLEQVGGIMCFLGQTRPWEQANLGAYVALVNEDECFEKEGEGEGSSGASASATTAVNYRRVVVESTRAENAPLVVKFWIDGDAHSPDGIKAQLTVAEGPSDANPLGIFRLQFSEEGGSGAIDAARDANGSVVLQFAESLSQREYSGQSAIAATLDIVDNEVVGGRFRGVFSFSDGRGRGDAGDLAVAFDSTHLLRTGTVRKESFNACLARDKYEMLANGYTLFNADDGSMVELESGFPIEVSAGGQTYYGHAGYHGIWLPNEVDRDSLSKVTRVEYTNGQRQETDYDVLQAPGKLTKYTARTVTLGELAGVELRQHSQGTATLVVWDGSSFKITGTMSYGEGGPTVEEASGDAEPMCWGGGQNQQCFYQFYVESLSADIRIPAGEESDDYEVRYHERRVVSGTDDVPSEELVCFERCLLMEPTEAQFSEQAFGFQAAGPFKTTTMFNQEAIQTFDLTSPLETYAWNPLTHNLQTADGTAFVAPAVTSEQQVWHSTGMLIPRSTYEAFSDPAAMNPWGLEAAVDEFYRFETGTSEWSRFVALTDDDGELVQFDQPINISYRHSQKNDLSGAEESDYYGKLFQLNYGGPGQLHGIPSEPQDMGPWRPHFSLAIGADLGDDYVAVPREVIQIMTPQEEAVCAGLDPSLAPPVPAPGFVGVMPDIGTAPTGELAVRYVGGEPAE